MYFMFSIRIKKFPLRIFSCSKPTDRRVLTIAPEQCKPCRRPTSLLGTSPEAKGPSHDLCCNSTPERCRALNFKARFVFSKALISQQAASTEGEPQAHRDMMHDHAPSAAACTALPSLLHKAEDPAGQSFCPFN